MADLATFLYAVRFVANGPRLPVKVWFGDIIDPVTAEVLDRGQHWQALLAGEPADPWKVIIEIDGLSGHPVIKGERITETEYDYLLAVAQWAKAHPDAPENDPYTPIDLNTIKPIF